MRYKVNKVIKENEEVEEQLKASKQLLEKYKEAIRKADLTQNLPMQPQEQ